jgi:hypothetical protein
MDYGMRLRAELFLQGHRARIAHNLIDALRLELAGYSDAMR